MGSGALQTSLQIYGNSVVIQVGYCGKQHVHRHKLGNSAAHGSASKGNFRGGNAEKYVCILGQSAAPEFGDGNDGGSAFFSQICNFQNFLGAAGHGNENSHIPGGHVGGVHQLNMVIRAENCIFVDSEKLGLEILRNQTGGSYTENPHGLCREYFPGSGFHSIGVKKGGSLLNSTEIVVLFRFNEILNALCIPNVREGGSRRSFVSIFVQLGEEGFFQILEAVIADGFAEPNPGSLADTGLPGQIGNGQTEHIVHMAEKIVCNLPAGVAEAVVHSPGFHFNRCQNIPFFLKNSLFWEVLHRTVKAFMNH